MLEDPKYQELKGGYNVPYDVRPAVARLAAGVDVEITWHELWEELHHQGHIGEASYVAVVMLVDLYGGDLKPDWNLFQLAALIEVVRYRSTNPPVPEWLTISYKEAWEKLEKLSLSTLSEGVVDHDTRQSALAILALAAGDLKLGAMLMHLDSSLIDEYVETYMGWKTLYAEKTSQ